MELIDVASIAGDWIKRDKSTQYLCLLNTSHYK